MAKYDPSKLPHRFRKKLQRGADKLIAAALGVPIERVDEHMREWWDYAAMPATEGEIDVPEYHRRGGELVGQMVQGGWHDYAPGTLPLLATGYQMLEEGGRGLLGHPAYYKGGGLLGRIGGLGMGLLGGLSDAKYNIEGINRARRQAALDSPKKKRVRNRKRK